MFRNYIKIAFRNMHRHRMYSAINIAGLAIGIACSILIMLYVNYELSYDSYNTKADRTYRLAVSALVGNTKINQTYSSAVTFTKLMQDFPEVETGLKIFKMGRVPVHIGDRIFYESDGLAVDSTFYEVFSIKLLSGNPRSVLEEPNSVVLSKSTALKYFNTTDVTGRMITLDLPYGMGKETFRISGVSEDMPANSHFHYNYLLSLTSFPELINAKGWSQNNFISYVVLKKGASSAAFDAKLKEFTRKYMGGKKYDAWVAKGNYWIYYLQPLRDIHLTSDLNGEFEPGGNKTSVYIFSVVSIIILLIACINFMNLSTARSSLRAKEVGLRKVVGAGRKRLVFQLLMESVITSYVALIVALIIVETILPYYSSLIGSEINFSYFNNAGEIVTLLLLGLGVGLIAGFYPAFVLSSFQPVKILKNEALQKSKKFSFRNVLVIFQFAVSIILIVGTIIIYRQLQFLQNKDLGFDKEQVLVVNNPGSLGEGTNSFKQSLKNYSGIVDVSGSTSLPGQSFSNIGFGAEGVDNNFTLNILSCDYDFANALKLKMSQGRFFSREFPSDSAAVIINQSAASLLGWKDPIGKKINNWGEQRGNFHVIGVVKDYNYESLHQVIRPMALFLNGGYYRSTQKFISIRLKTGEVSKTLEFVNSQWNKFAPGAPFDYSFLDRDYESLYNNEKRAMTLFTVFSALAIFIACLGLFGLVAFTTERRAREIGIRKILGASISGILFMLIKDFTRWVLIANIIAIPAAYYFMNNWLKDFAYRIDIGAGVFIIAGLIAFSIALLTVGLQALKAATSNPANSLRYE